MNKYETVIIITDKIEEKETKNVIKKIKKFIKDNGEIIEAEDMGMRKLAYEIRKCQYGHSSQQESTNPSVYGETYFYIHSTE